MGQLENFIEYKYRRSMIDFKGAKWLKCDFHLHTPASHCFRDHTVTAEQWVNKCLEQQLDCVAVTDHNTGAWIDIIKEAAKDKNLVVFPGVELTCDTSKVHILVIFDVNKTRQDIEDFIIKCGIDRRNFAASDACSTKTCNEIISLAHECGALPIPAHIDEFNGLGLLSKSAIDGIFSTECVNAVQIVFPKFVQKGIRIDDELCEEYNCRYGRNAGDIGKDNIKKYYTCVQEAVKKKIALLTFSDNPDSDEPSKHGINGIGKAYTWIKMSQNPSLESIRQAFLFPERIRNCFDSIYCPFTEPNIWIKSIEIKNTKLTKGEEPFRIEFNPQLTTIIGGRGSGKSSLFRFLRGVFKQNKDIELLSELKGEQSRFFQKEKDGTGVLKDTTELVVYLVRDSILYKVEYKYEKSSVNIYKKNAEEWEIVTDANFLDFFVLEQYSQKQIFEMAKKTNTLKGLIDSASEEIIRLTNDCQELTEHYCSAKAELYRSLGVSEKISKLNTEISDLKTKINSFKTSNITELANKRDNFVQSSQLIEAYLSNIANNLDFVEDNLKKLDLSKAPLQLRTLSEAYRNEINQLFSPLYSQFNDFVVTAQNNLHSLKVNVNQLYQTFQKDSNFSKDMEDCLNVYAQKKEELEKNGIDDFGNYNNYLESLRVKQTQLDELQKVVLSIPSLKENIEQIRNAIYDRMEERTRARKDIVSKCNTSKVRIDVTPLGDRKQFMTAFRHIIQKDKGYDKGLQKIESICFPQRPGNFKQLYNSILSDLLKIRTENISDLGFDGTFSNMIKSLSEDQMSRLEVLVPGDTIDVKYKPNGSSNFISIVNASAGQKTTAVLTFILSQSGCPLLLDQPEDDLDNRLVCDLVVEKIKAIKEKRQVIVITHNANIPVIGDSEYIVTMDSSSRYLKEHSDGMVEDAAVRTDICEIMEGGEDAFAKRALRYRQLKH